jgi:hypothetical protein
MTPMSRFIWALRQRAVRCYELLLYALLLALGVATVMPGGSQEHEVQCGNIHSSTAVISR